MDDALVERVLRVVELVPAGSVVSYGDVAAAVGTGPRQVGRIMAQWGSEVPWWRVTNAAGQLPEALLLQARRRWQAEGVALLPSGRGCRITAHRWPDEQLRRAAVAVAAEVRALSSDEAETGC